MNNKSVFATICIIASLTCGLATGGVIKNQVDCTAPNRTGTDVETGYEFNIPCTEVKKMVGDDYEDNAPYEPGSEICGKYVTPEDAPYNWDGPCGTSNAVAAQPTE